MYTYALFCWGASRLKLDIINYVTDVSGSYTVVAVFLGKQGLHSRTALRYGSRSGHFSSITFLGRLAPKTGPLPMFSPVADPPMVATARILTGTSITTSTRSSSNPLRIISRNFIRSLLYHRLIPGSMTSGSSRITGNLRRWVPGG